MNNYIYIYFSKLPEGCWLADVEEELEEILGEAGEVVGSGFGASGGNIDIELFEDTDVLEDIRSYLLACGFEKDTILDIDGERETL